MSEGAEVVRAEPGAIARAAELIVRGEVVGFPSETSYGLAGDALSASAVAAVVQVKGRKAGQYLLVLVSDEAMLTRVVAAVPAAARQLIARHWPGPLTLVLPAVAGLPAPLVNPQGGVGVRISSDPIARELLRRCGRPITATSANRSGEPPAREAARAALPGVALVLDDGPRQAPASTVAQVLDQEVLVLRPGPVQL